MELDLGKFALLLRFIPPLGHLYSPGVAQAFDKNLSPQPWKTTGHWVHSFRGDELNSFTSSLFSFKIQEMCWAREKPCVRGGHVPLRRHGFLYTRTFKKFGPVWQPSKQDLNSANAHTQKQAMHWGSSDFQSAPVAPHATLSSSGFSLPKLRLILSLHLESANVSRKENSWWLSLHLRMALPALQF